MPLSSAQYEAARELFKAFGRGNISEQRLPADANGPALDYLTLGGGPLSPEETAEVAGRLAVLAVAVKGYLTGSTMTGEICLDVSVSRVANLDDEERRAEIERLRRRVADLEQQMTDKGM